MGNIHELKALVESTQKWNKWRSDNPDDDPHHDGWCGLPHRIAIVGPKR